VDVEDRLGGMQELRAIVRELMATEPELARALVRYAKVLRIESANDFLRKTQEQT
jgi:hypothetical protein